MVLVAPFKSARSARPVSGISPRESPLQFHRRGEVLPLWQPSSLIVTEAPSMMAPHQRDRWAKLAGIAGSMTVTAIRFQPNSGGCVSTELFQGMSRRIKAVTEAMRSQGLARFRAVRSPISIFGLPCSQSRCATTAPRPDVISLIQ